MNSATNRINEIYKGDLNRIRFALAFAWGQLVIPTDYDSCVALMVKLAEGGK